MIKDVTHKTACEWLTLHYYSGSNPKLTVARWDTHRYIFKFGRKLVTYNHDWHQVDEIKMNGKRIPKYMDVFKNNEEVQTLVKKTLGIVQHTAECIRQVQLLTGERNEQ